MTHLQALADAPSGPATPRISRAHRTRLMHIWRSAGWPCKDALEIDLLAAQLIALHRSEQGCETLRLTDEGIRCLAQARQRAARALSAHDRLGQQFAEHLLGSGRIVWRELSLRAVVDPPALSPACPCAAGPVEEAAQVADDSSAAGAGLGANEAHLSQSGEATGARGHVTHRQRPRAQQSSPSPSLWSEDLPPTAVPNVWRMARPDLFSVRNTSVPAYLQPMVHEIKASRADLLSDLRHGAKGQAYQWLCEECYYVFPAGVAEPEEIPEEFGVWVQHGSLEAPRFELLRPARHAPCTLPFAVWMALCKAAPLRSEREPSQARLTDAPEAALSDAPEALPAAVSTTGAAAEPAAPQAPSTSPPADPPALPVQP